MHWYRASLEAADTLHCTAAGEYPWWRQSNELVSIVYFGDNVPNINKTLGLHSSNKRLRRPNATESTNWCDYFSLWAPWLLIKVDGSCVVVHNVYVSIHLLIARKEIWMETVSLRIADWGFHLQHRKANISMWFTYDRMQSNDNYNWKRDDWKWRLFLRN